MHSADDLIYSLQQFPTRWRAEYGTIISRPRNPLSSWGGILENAVQAIFPHDPQAMSSVPTNDKRQSGLTRSETLWLIALISGIVLLIVNTLHAEVERGHLRMANDTLSHLSSQLYLGLESNGIHSIEQLDLPLIGPGVIPEDLQDGEQMPKPLQDLFLPGAFLPDDPWGNGYVLMEGEVNGRPALFITCVGNNDELQSRPTADTELCRRVHLPPKRD